MIEGNKGKANPHNRENDTDTEADLTSDSNKFVEDKASFGEVINVLKMPVSKT
jgi:hypothetical protein